MAVTIKAVPTHFEANSYALLAEANSYFDGRYGASDWDGASDAQKNAALFEATKLVDVFRFKDLKYRRSPEQPLEFPRSNAIVKSGQFDSTSESGGNRSFVDADLAGEEEYPDNYFNYWACEMRSGDAEYEILQVSDFVRSTGTVTLDGDFSTAPSAGDEYRLIEKVPNEIKDATYEIANWILSGAADELLDPSLTNYSIGEFSESFSKAVYPRLPARAKYILNKYINNLGQIK